MEWKLYTSTYWQWSGSGKKKKKLKSETQVLQKQLQWRLMKKGIVIHLNNTMR